MRNLGIVAILLVLGVGVFIVGVGAVTIGNQNFARKIEERTVVTGCQAFWNEVLKAADAENWERAAQMSTVYLACRQRLESR